MIGDRSSRAPIGPSRRWRSLWLVLVLMVAAPAEAYDQDRIERVELSSVPVRFSPDEPNRSKVGRLVWRGGIEITSGDRRIGGFSGLLVSADGAQLLAVSDKGRCMTARLRYDEDGHLAGLDDGAISYLRGLNGDVLKGGGWRDAESLAALDDGTILVGFEHRHRIWRYSSNNGPLVDRPAVWPKPDGLDEAPSNNGLEALVALEGNRLLALGEYIEDGPDSIGFLWQDEGWSRLTYERGSNMMPTGATRLPGGDVLVLERGFTALFGFTVRLVRVAASDIRPGVRLHGRVLARWGLPHTVDNFEAIAAVEGPGGETLIYLLSDDNFNMLQRTLLLMFALEESETGE